MSRRTNIAIHVILALLIAAPLHYYLLNHDKRDERFAWRMFSPTRIERCAPQFLLGTNETPIKTAEFFHSAWVGLAQRGRQQVIVAMGQALCKQHPDQSLHIRLQCETRPGSTEGNRGALYDRDRQESDADVELVARGLFDFCETGAL